MKEKKIFWMVLWTALMACATISYLCLFFLSECKTYFIHYILISGIVFILNIIFLYLTIIFKKKILLIILLALFLLSSIALGINLYIILFKVDFNTQHFVYVFSIFIVNLIMMFKFILPGKNKTRYNI
jgi:hypothetical protein